MGSHCGYPFVSKRYCDIFAVNCDAYWCGGGKCTASPPLAAAFDCPALPAPTIAACSMLIYHLQTLITCISHISRRFHDYGDSLCAQTQTSGARRRRRATAPAATAARLRVATSRPRQTSAHCCGMFRFPHQSRNHTFVFSIFLTQMYSLYTCLGYAMKQWCRICHHQALQ